MPKFTTMPVEEAPNPPKKEIECNHLNKFTNRFGRTCASCYWEGIKNAK